MMAHSLASQSNLRLQRQLFITLVVQTCIPLFASYLPTVISWYAPIFGIDIGWWNTNVSTVALAAFPCIDPLAVIILIPNYRNAILRKRNASAALVSTLNQADQNMGVVLSRC
uniref:Uncharacterized protein n=1 Tax=Caenorhabditis japonica TaxID=281687 RepID=A0A8R1DIG9_CAEJA